MIPDRNEGDREVALFLFQLGMVTSVTMSLCERMKDRVTEVTAPARAGCPCH
jgi:hypothetical protein